MGSPPPAGRSSAPPRPWSCWRRSRSGSPRRARRASPCACPVGRAWRVDVDPRLLTTDPLRVLDDPEIQIVIELIGGEEPARQYLLRAIEQGKHVVTANKALLAVHGDELFAAAERRGVDLYFEASV